MPRLNMLVQPHYSQSLSVKEQHEYVVRVQGQYVTHLIISVRNENGSSVPGTMLEGISTDSFIFVAESTGSYEIRVERNNQMSAIAEFDIAVSESVIPVPTPNYEANYSDASLTGGEHYVGKHLEASVNISDANGFDQ